MSVRSTPDARTAEQWNQTGLAHVCERVTTVEDRIVQLAVRLVIEPISEAGFREGSFGFRPERGCHGALC